MTPRETTNPTKTTNPFGGFVQFVQFVVRPGGTA